ncbi:MGMT family protein [Chitinophaga sp. NPDC101104]|uniref:MGMT family protein n=1 Tax=Chitinophaga sp. NPDC101104 TaxID=3390561 RepID=UPI003D02B240
MKTSPKKKESASSKPAAQKTEPDFIERVFSIARKIPRGRVTSYGAIAERAGIRLTARMVGWAMHQAGKAHPPVPAHRVVNSKGLLTGAVHFATPTLMQELLEQEGVEVRNNQVVGFTDKFWNPPLTKKNTALPKKKK